MKKICASNRIGTIARRDAGTRTAKALSLHAGNGKSHGINVAAADLHSDSRWQPDATRSPLTANASVLEQLAGALDQITAADNPRTFKLLQSRRHKLTRKLIEEACEVTVEAVKRDRAGVVRESADLLYHLVVLWFHIGIEPVEIWEEMQTRANALGIAEKRPKTAVSKTLADKFNR
jgi:phosphoribosyl-ATP pyrophosphohydrolase